MLLGEACREAVELVRELGFKQQVAVVLNADGLTAEEIADVMHANVATVRSNLRFGHERMRELRAQRVAAERARTESRSR